MHLMDDFQNSHVRRIVGADALTFWMIQRFTAKQPVSFLEVWTSGQLPVLFIYIGPARFEGSAE